MSKLTKASPTWHQEAIGLLNQHVAGIHETFIDSTKKAVWLGMFLNEIKSRGKEDGSIPHGEFGPWIKKNVVGIQWSQINVYMSLARNVCEKGKIQIPDFQEFARGGVLPPEAIKLIEGKTQQQLCLAFKDPNRTAGRLPGEGGRKKVSLSEEAEMRKELARTDWFGKGGVSRLLHGYQDKFVMLADDDVLGQIADLELALNARKAWLKQPHNRRDATAIAQMFNKK